MSARRRECDRPKARVRARTRSGTQACARAVRTLGSAELAPGGSANSEPFGRRRFSGDAVAGRGINFAGLGIVDSAPGATDRLCVAACCRSTSRMAMWLGPPTPTPKLCSGDSRSAGAEHKETPAPRDPRRMAATGSGESDGRA